MRKTCGRSFDIQKERQVRRTVYLIVTAKSNTFGSPLSILGSQISLRTPSIRHKSCAQNICLWELGSTAQAVSAYLLYC